MADPGSMWTRYWRFDRIASCFDGSGGSNYHEGVADSWREFFAGLPERSAILDLCTGNGAVAVIAAEVGRASGRDFRITGVDRADIDPPRFVTRHADELSGVEFHGNMAAERLPFPAAAFDAVVSQYGIEYTDMDRSLGEALRTLSPGGRFRFVMHAAEGSVRRRAEVVAGEAQALLDDIRLVDAAIRAIEAVCAAERQPGAPGAAVQAAEEADEAFATALGRTAELLETAAAKNMIHNAGSVLVDTFEKRGHFAVPTLVAKAREVGDEILAHRQRLLALVEAAVSQRGVDRLQQRLAALGAVEVRASQLVRDSELIAHTLEGRRARPDESLR